MRSRSRPAHDFNDFEVGRRHGLEVIGILDRRARLNGAVPEAYRGLDRFEARDRVVADLEALGLVERIERQRHTVPYGDRGGVPIEPYLTEQWYANAGALAKPAIEAVEAGRTRFVPETLGPAHTTSGCVTSNRGAFPGSCGGGTRIPAWYGPDGTVLRRRERRRSACRRRPATHYGADIGLDPRSRTCLDTWFSSASLALFNHRLAGARRRELARYYPGDVLVTGFDIIFFWVARMMMMGLHFMGEVPFRTVYIHALVRDQHGAKMSKSKGNIIDPLEMCGKYGADALRFTLAALAAPGRDVKLSESRVAGYRNFTTKLWNAARFCAMNGCRPAADFDHRTVREVPNRWIVAKTVETRRGSRRR